MSLNCRDLPYLVNNMRNAVLENQVRLCDQPAVDVIAATTDADSEGLAALRSQDRSIFQVGKVADGAGDDVVRDQLRGGDGGVGGGECGVGG